MIFVYNEKCLSKVSCGVFHRIYNLNMELGHTIEDSRKKYPELTNQVLEELRVYGEERGVAQVPDEKLALFAHSCYFDLEAAKRCMSVYYKLRSTVPEFFANRDPTSDYLQHSLKALWVAFFIKIPGEKKNNWPSFKSAPQLCQFLRGCDIPDYDNFPR